MKLFLTGDLGAGKSTVIRNCLALYNGPVWGFFSYKEPRDGPECSVWLADVRHPDKRHRVAQIGTAGRRVWPEVFDTAGVALLEEINTENPGLVLMDEIGFMESQAPLFQQEILRVLALDLPVLGVLRTMPQPPLFLKALHQRSDITRLAVTQENRDALPKECFQLLSL